jgi:biopolymer transport protein ExbB
VFEILGKAGFMVWPIVGCSVIALAIILERFWSLQVGRILPKGLVTQAWNLHKNRQLDNKNIAVLQKSSPLGKVLAAGLVNREYPREVMKESIEEVGRQVAHELERFLNMLGTIAAITPLMGLLGTVMGMIAVFDNIAKVGVGDPSSLAGGIDTALYTTAAGLMVAIPSYMFYRFFRGKVDSIVIQMEEEALKMVDIMHGDRVNNEGDLD